MSNAYLAKSMPDSSDQQHQPPMTSEDALAREERKEHTSMLLLLTPALVMVVVLLIMPLCWLAFQSVQTEEGFSLANYIRIFQESIYWDTFALTFKISFLVTILSIVMGFPIAYAASRLQGFWANLILICVILPFWTSVLVRAYAWLVLLQRRGLVNQTLMDLGIIDQPLTLMHNTTGTVIGTLHVMLPFMVLPLYSVMKKIPQDLMQASESLGAKPFYTFRRHPLHAVEERLVPVEGPLLGRELQEARLGERHGYHDQHRDDQVQQDRRDQHREQHVGQAKVTQVGKQVHLARSQDAFDGDEAIDAPEDQEHHKQQHQADCAGCAPGVIELDVALHQHRHQDRAATAEQFRGDEEA